MLLLKKLKNFSKKVEIDLISQYNSYVKFVHKSRINKEDGIENGVLSFLLTLDAGHLILFYFWNDFLLGQSIPAFVFLFLKT